MEAPMTDVFLDTDMAHDDVLWYETQVVEHKMDDSVHTPHSHSVEVEMDAFGPEIIDYDMVDDVEALEAPATPAPDAAMHSDLTVYPEGRTIFQEESHAENIVSSISNTIPEPGEGDADVPSIQPELSDSSPVPPATPATTAQEGEVTETHTMPTVDEPQTHTGADTSHAEPTADSEGTSSPRPEEVHNEPLLAPLPEEGATQSDAGISDAGPLPQPPEDEQEAESEASHAAEEVTHYKEAATASEAVSERKKEHHSSAADSTEQMPSVLVKLPSSSSLPSFYLFSALQRSDKAEGEAPPVFHNEFKHLFVEPMEHTFSLLRAMSAELELMPHGELSLTSEALDLTITEDNVYAKEISLNDLYTLQVGCEIDGPLVVRLDQLKSRFIMRYNAIINEMAKVAKEESEQEEDEEQEVVAVPDEVAAALFAAEEEENVQEEQTNEEPKEQTLTRLVEPAAGGEEASNDADHSQEANPDGSDPATHPDPVGDEEPGPESYPPFDRSDGDGDDEAEAFSELGDEATPSRDAGTHADNHVEETLPETDEASVPQGAGQDDETQVPLEETYVEETQVYETQDYDETNDSSFYPNDEADGKTTELQREYVHEDSAADHEDEPLHASSAEVASSHTVVSSRPASPAANEIRQPPRDKPSAELETGQAKDEEYSESEQPEGYAEYEEGYEEYPQESYPEGEDAHYEDDEDDSRYVGPLHLVDETAEDWQDEDGVEGDLLPPSIHEGDDVPEVLEVNEHDGDTSVESVVIETSDEAKKAVLGRSISQSSSKRSFDSRADDDDVGSQNDQAAIRVEYKRVRVE